MWIDSAGELEPTQRAQHWGNAFLEVKGEGVIPPSYIPLALQGGQRAAGKSTGVSLRPGLKAHHGRGAHHCKGLVIMCGKDPVPERQLTLRLGPEQNSNEHKGCDGTHILLFQASSSTLSSLGTADHIKAPHHSPSELPLSSVCSASTRGPRPVIAVVTDATRHPERALVFNAFPSITSTSHQPLVFQLEHGEDLLTKDNRAGSSIHVHLTHHESYPTRDLLSSPLLSIKKSHVCPAHTNVRVTANLGDVVLWLGI